MPTNLFSTYRQGENRVTSTFLAVLERMSLPIIDRLLGNLLREPTFRALTFRNQVRVPGGVPDARIMPGEQIWIETKTAEKPANSEQITNQLRGIGQRGGGRFLLLTPDFAEPDFLKTLGFGNQVIWNNFTSLSEEIQRILNDAVSPPTEREAFLLREFVSMMRDDGLLSMPDERVLVRAAGKWAWSVYRALSVYTCVPKEVFRPSGHFAFYANKEIKPLVPKILDIPAIEEITIVDRSEIDRLEGEQRRLALRLHDRINVLSSESDTSWLPEFTLPHKVVFLAEPEDADTLKLPSPVLHEERGPWMQGRSRYVTLQSLEMARFTRELESA